MLAVGHQTLTMTKKPLSKSALKPLRHRAFVLQYDKQQTIGNMFSLEVSGSHPMNFFRLPVIEAGDAEYRYSK